MVTMAMSFLWQVIGSTNIPTYILASRIAVCQQDDDDDVVCPGTRKSAWQNYCRGESLSVVIDRTGESLTSQI